MSLLLNIFKKHSWLAFVILTGMSFFLSCAITTALSEQKVLASSVSKVIIGGSRAAMGQHFYKIADLYFHKGAEYVTEKSFENDIFQRTRQIVSPSGHFHMAQSNIKEIMPWLWLSIKMDPHNIETYLVASFWLSNAAERPTLALELLKKAQLENPYNYQIPIEKGRIYLKQGELENAKHAFDTALIFWTKSADQLDEYQNMDRAEALLYRGLLAEHENDTALAINLYEKILTHFPNREGIRDRISGLKKGDTPEILADSFWNNILKADIKNKSKCKHEHQHDENCHHDEHKEHVHDENCHHEDENEEHVHDENCNHENEQTDTDI